MNTFIKSSCSSFQFWTHFMLSSRALVIFWAGGAESTSLDFVLGSGGGAVAGIGGGSFNESSSSSSSSSLSWSVSSVFFAFKLSFDCTFSPPLGFIIWVAICFDGFLLNKNIYLKTWEHWMSWKNKVSFKMNIFFVLKINKVNRLANRITNLICKLYKYIKRVKNFLNEKKTCKGLYFKILFKIFCLFFFIIFV